MLEICLAQTLTAHVSGVLHLYDKECQTGGIENDTERKFVKKHPEILGHSEKCLLLMASNPSPPFASTHCKASSKNSISITLSDRLTIEFLIDGKEIIPIAIGTHDQVYIIRWGFEFLEIQDSRCDPAST
jgi:hypothetical protein